MTLTRRVFNERRNVVLPILILLGLNVIVLGAVVYPLKQSVDGAAEARSRAELVLASAQKDHKIAVSQRSSKSIADVELKKFYGEVLPKDFASARNLTNFWLGRIADQTKLTFRAGTYDSDEVRGSHLMKYKGEVTLVGEYSDIRRFLYEVETAQEFVVIESVSLSSPGAGQPGALLEVALSVATYYAAPTVVSK